MKMSVSKLKKQIADEKRSAKMYRHYGYKEIAKQETAHRRRLERDLKRRK
jgi:hypothetical protein